MKLKNVFLLCGALLFGLIPLAGCEREPDPQNEAVFPETDLPEVPQLPADSVPQTPEKTEARYIRVLVDGLNVRTGMDTDSPSLGMADKGVLLKYGAEKGGWYETEYRGKTAYVSADARYTEKTKLQTGDKITEKIIEAGLPLLGTPYVYGAVRQHDGKGHLNSNFSSAAFDCSSLMQYMFHEGGNILLDVTTRTQIKQGEKVERKNIRRGDLLFFTNASRYYNTGIERVGHVALYLGDNYILHTASDYAKIEQISAKRWEYFLEARRVR